MATKIHVRVITYRGIKICVWIEIFERATSADELVIEKSSGNVQHDCLIVPQGAKN